MIWQICFYIILFCAICEFWRVCLNVNHFRLSRLVRKTRKFYAFDNVYFLNKFWQDWPGEFYILIICLCDLGLLHTAAVTKVSLFRQLVWTCHSWISRCVKGCERSLLWRLCFTSPNQLEMSALHTVRTSNYHTNICNTPTINTSIWQYIFLNPQWPDITLAERKSQPASCPWCRSGKYVVMGVTGCFLF